MINTFNLLFYHLTTTPKQFAMHHGDVLKLLRNAKKMSQDDLAHAINCRQQMISYWEQQEHLNGESLDMLLKGLNSNREEWEIFKKLPPPRKMKPRNFNAREF